MNRAKCLLLRRIAPPLSCEANKGARTHGPPGTGALRLDGRNNHTHAPATHCSSDGPLPARLTPACCTHHLLLQSGTFHGRPQHVFTYRIRVTNLRYVRHLAGGVGWPGHTFKSVFTQRRAIVGVWGRAAGLRVALWGGWGVGGRRADAGTRSGGGTGGQWDYPQVAGCSKCTRGCCCTRLWPKEVGQSNSLLHIIPSAPRAFARLRWQGSRLCARPAGGGGELRCAARWPARVQALHASCGARLSGSAGAGRSRCRCWAASGRSRCGMPVAAGAGAVAELSNRGRMVRARASGHLACAWTGAGAAGPQGAAFTHHPAAAASRYACPC